MPVDIKQQLELSMSTNEGQQHTDVTLADTPWHAQSRHSGQNTMHGILDVTATGVGS